MGQKSSISRLPLPVKKAIDDALKTSRFTLDEILASIREQFGDDSAPSRSALGRYSQNFEELGKRMRQSREIASVWVDKLGSEPQGDVGRLVMEMLRNLVFEATGEMYDSTQPLDLKAVNALALATHRLETANRHSLEREKQQRQAALEEAAKHAEGAGKDMGLSDEAIQAIRRRIMVGMAGG